MSTSIEKLYQAGLACYQAKDYEGAIKQFQLIVNDPTIDHNSQYYRSSMFNIASNTIMAGRYDEGVKLMFESAKQDHPRALYHVGVIFERQNDCRAIMCYRRAAILGSEEALAAIKDLKIESILANDFLTPIHWD